MTNLIAMLCSFDAGWVSLITEVWRFVRKAWEDLTEVGMYEVLHHEATLELKDKQGNRAVLTKRQKVRYLQNHIIAYQDQAWGDGEILLDYQCSPGIEVDRYRPAETTYILISLRDTKSKGDIDDFHIQWVAKNAFSRDREVWATRISHRTKSLKLQLILPSSRPPRKAKITERLSKRVYQLDSAAFVQLADKKWSVVWETNRVCVNQQYLFDWEW